MAFNSADAYARFMGRFSEPLAPVFADFAGLGPEAQVLDVGCGPGVLTEVLVDRHGAGAVSAIDPSEAFVEAARSRLPELDVRVGSAESLPYADDTFDAALAQLVVHFMADPVQGLREMARVTRPGGVVAACVWDHSGDRGPLSTFWSVVKGLDPVANDESTLAGARPGALADLFEAADLREIEDSTLEVTVGLEGFEDWWEPYTLGVGPSGDYVARLSPDRVERLRAAARERIPDGPFELTVAAWATRATVG
jgi:SAM-dependent methyltransferase